MSTHFIVSVGTSIISNYEKKFKDNNKKLLTFKEGGLPDENNKLPAPKKYYTNFEMIKNGIKSNLGAEEKSIDSTIKEKQLEIANCFFHFIATNTNECLFCASYLCYILEEKQCPEKNINVYVPPHLKDAKDEDFVKSGVPELLSKLADLLDNVEKNPEDEAIIIPTGGYKAIIPYMTIAGILYKCPIYYIYEDSNTLLELPSLPLGVQSSEFRSALVILDNIVNTEKEVAKKYLNELDDRFKHLVYEKDQTYHFTAFGERLKKLFHEQPLSPLAIRVIGNTLIPKLGQYTEQFKEITRLGETIWIGDKAPEMADHARYHHVNLLGYTELILSPILQDNKDFLTEAELFLLLGMVYFHDCGHSRCLIPINDKQIPLLPTEIRNYHNLLGYQRMTDHAFINSLKRQGLDINPDTLKNIATLSLYHRKNMSLLNGIYTCPNNNQFQPIQAIEISQEGQPVRGDLLLALFRIIDGMDKQLARAGDSFEISMRAESILADLDHLKGQIDRLCQIFEPLLICPEAQKAKKSADELFQIISKKYIEQEKTKDDSNTERQCKGYYKRSCPNQSKSPSDHSETPYYLQLEKELAGNAFFPLAWEYLYATCRLMFQAIQPTYYYSDLLLQMPIVHHHKIKDKQCITINYPIEKNTDVQERIKTIYSEIQYWFNQNIKDYTLFADWGEPQKYVKGIRLEYCSLKSNEVATILDNYNIIIQFQCDGQPIRCCMNK